MKLFQLLKTCLLPFFAGVVLTSTGATTYHVDPLGDDAADGSSRETAFLTVQRGVDALDSGDTLKIHPGEYLEAVFRKGLGAPEHETHIRAAIPGTVLLRTDVRAPAFTPLPGHRWVHVAAYDGTVTGVRRRECGTVLGRKPLLSELEAIPGSFHFDARQGRLYLSTPDLAPPRPDDYVIMVIEGAGLRLEQPRRVVVNGLSASGFGQGIVLHDSVDGVIRDCRAFFNQEGIVVSGPASVGNRIEQCRAWRNFRRGTGVNIVGYRPNALVVSNCVSYLGGRFGIRLYGATADAAPSSIMHSLSWGSAGEDLNLKGGALHRTGRAIRSVAVGNVGIDNLEHGLIGGNNHKHLAKEFNTLPDTILFSREPDLDPDREFADPANFDFRLQPASRFRGTAPDGSDRGPFPYRDNIYYVRPDGDDQADGSSLENAWRTPERAAAVLRGGDTLYLAPGTYAGGMTLSVAAEAPIEIRGRGADPVVLQGELQVLRAGGVRFERLHFAGSVHVRDSRKVAFHNCRFDASNEALTADNVAGLRVTHGHFSAAGLALSESREIFLAGNRFEAGTALHVDDLAGMHYVDYNLYAQTDGVWRVAGNLRSLNSLSPAFERYGRVLTPDTNPAASGLPGAAGAGIYLPQRDQPAITRITPPVLHAVTDTTADLEWKTSRLVSCRLSWGPMEGDFDVEDHGFDANGFTTFSLIELLPDTEYRFRVRFAEPVVTSDATDRPVTEQVLTFRTAAIPHVPVRYRVAPDGDDAHDGLSRETALRTVAEAARRVRPGDVVWMAEGTYAETVRMRATGTAAQPIRFQAEPGARVVFESLGRQLGTTFEATGKHHLQFDGFYFMGFGGLGAEDLPTPAVESGPFTLYQAANVSITRCLINGRLAGGGYPTRLVAALQCPDLLISNCVIANTFNSLYLNDVPRARIENNVFLLNWIHAYNIVNLPDTPYTFSRNIVTDSLKIKQRVMLFEVGRVESMVHRDNAFVLRLPDAEKQMFMFYGNIAYERAAGHFGIPQDPHDQPVLEKITRMGLEAYQARFGDTGCRIVDPAFQAGLALDAAGVDRDGDPVFLPDRLAGKTDLDFPDLFSANPALIKRNIGLERGAFADFHFND